MNDLLIDKLYLKTLELLEEMSLSLVNFEYDSDFFYFEIKDNLDEDETTYNFVSTNTDIREIDEEALSDIVLSPLFDQITPAAKLDPKVKEAETLSKEVIENIRKIVEVNKVGSTQLESHYLAPGNWSKTPNTDIKINYDNSYNCPITSAGYWYTQDPDNYSLAYFTAV
jgi:hypothetical protein